MSDDERTQFRFDFGGITLELTGERAFVQEMYRRVMEDVQQARARAEQAPKVRGEGKQSSSKAIQSQAPPALPRSVWVHRSDDLMRKIYMVSEEDVGKSWLAHFLNEAYITSVYVDKPLFETFFPGLDGGQTLWAEFTGEGRRRIAEATRPHMRALSLPKKP